MALETYIRAVDIDITQTLLRYPSHCHNLTKEERRALRSLMPRTDIVINKADKGSATVTVSREDYISKVRSHLDNKGHYLKLDEDPTQRFSLEIEQVLTGMTNHFSIPEELIRVLLPKESKVSRIYILPKIHKPGNPARPIVSSCGSPPSK